MSLNQTGPDRVKVLHSSVDINIIGQVVHENHAVARSKVKNTPTPRNRKLKNLQKELKQKWMS